MKCFLDGMDSFKGSAGSTEIGHSLDNRPLEPPPEFLDETGLDLLVVNLDLLNLLLGSKIRPGLT